MNIEELIDEDAGDLLISGWAARWGGEDREGDHFAGPGVFSQAIKDFVTTQPSLCFAHSPDKQLGRVLRLEEKNEGLWMEAKVSGSIREHPELRHIYSQIKRGDLAGLSLGGVFSREGGTKPGKIVKADIFEVSVAPIVMDKRTVFTVSPTRRELERRNSELAAAAQKLELVNLRRQAEVARTHADVLRMQQETRELQAV